MLGLVAVIFAVSLIPLQFVWASGGQGHGHPTDSTADSSATADATGGDSKSVSTGGNSRVTVNVPSHAAGQTISGGPVDVSSGDTILSTIHEYEAVAQAIGSLHLGRCTNGGGAGSKRASFNVGGSDFLCDITYIVPLITGKAKNLYNQGLHDEAYFELQKIDELIEMALNYLHDREKTASWGAWFRDLWWIMAIVLVAL